MGNNDVKKLSHAAFNFTMERHVVKQRKNILSTVKVERKNGEIKLQSAVIGNSDGIFSSRIQLAGSIDDITFLTCSAFLFEARTGAQRSSQSVVRSQSERRGFHIEGGVGSSRRLKGNHEIFRMRRRQKRIVDPTRRADPRSKKF